MSDWGELEQEEAVGTTRACRQARAGEEGSQATEARGAKRSTEKAVPAAEPWKPEIEKLQQEQEAQRRKLEELQREIDSLKQRPEEGTGAVPVRAPELESLRRWMMTHREEVARYRGKRVAIHPEKGIIASADSYTQLDELLKKMGVSDTEVFIDVISARFPSS